MTGVLKTGISLSKIHPQEKMRNFSPKSPGRLGYQRMVIRFHFSKNGCCFNDLKVGWIIRATIAAAVHQLQLSSLILAGEDEVLLRGWAMLKLCL